MNHWGGEIRDEKTVEKPGGGRGGGGVNHQWKIVATYDSVVNYSLSENLKTDEQIHIQLCFLKNEKEWNWQA